jgi:riboflavin synthase
MMFTGIVSELGTVASIRELDGASSLTVTAPETVVGVAVGDSIAVNGVCLTAVAVGDSAFTVEIVEESLQRSSLGSLRRGDTVNLERPMVADGRFDGHIVQGHVDGVGHIEEIRSEGDASRLRVSIPRGLARYIVEKGSIAVDGTSLTVTAVSDAQTDKPWFEMVLIPHTLDATVLGSADIGSPVNLEVDVIAKYVERLVRSAP